MSTPVTTSGTRVVRVVGVVVAVSAAIFGAGMVLVAATVGHCSAFGGRCPADAPPIWDDDVFGMSAMGAALVAGPLLALRRGPRRWTVALGGAATAAILIGLIVRSGAHG